MVQVALSFVEQAARLLENKAGKQASRPLYDQTVPLPEPEPMPELYLSRDESRAIDSRAIEEFGMSGLVLMENAGRGVADVLCGLGIGGPVVIVCGKGNNGGDGFVIARHLEIRGHRPKVLLPCPPNKLTGDAEVNYQILDRAGTPIVTAPPVFDAAWLEHELESADWIVDAMLGTGARGAPRPPLDQVIDQLNNHSANKLAIDVPSGLDCDTGQPSSTTFRADHTCTFVASKIGFRAVEAAEYLGRIHVIDIGVPRRLLDDL